MNATRGDEGDDDGKDRSIRRRSAAVRSILARARRGTAVAGRAWETCSRSCSSGGGTNGVHLLGSSFRPQNAMTDDDGTCGARLRMSPPPLRKFPRPFFCRRARGGSREFPWTPTARPRDATSRRRGASHSLARRWPRFEPRRERWRWRARARVRSRDRPRARRGRARPRDGASRRRRPACGPGGARWFFPRRRRRARRPRARRPRTPPRLRRTRRRRRWTWTRTRSRCATRRDAVVPPRPRVRGPRRPCRARSGHPPAPRSRSQHI